MGKEPLYPHVPKSKLGALICGQCGARFHSMEELDKHLAKYHPEAYASMSREEAEERNFYYCASRKLHPHSEIVQVETTEKDPKCPYCGSIMTYGKYW